MGVRSSGQMHDVEALRLHRSGRETAARDMHLLNCVAASSPPKKFYCWRYCTEHYATKLKDKFDIAKGNS
jgi:hypothetical protein